MEGKYIIFESQYGIDYAVLFNKHFTQHQEVKGEGKAVAAGFFKVYCDGRMVREGWRVVVWGQSISLKLNSRPNIDDQIILEQFVDKD